jgi:hypothetical protein
LPLRHAIAAHRDIGSLIESLTDPRTCNGEPATLSAIATGKRDEVSRSGPGRGAALMPLHQVVLALAARLNPLSCPPTRPSAPFPCRRNLVAGRPPYSPQPLRRS